MPLHATLAGTELHDAFHFVQETDPGAVGAGKYWLQISTAEVKRRNVANDDWTLVSTAKQGTVTSVAVAAPDVFSVSGSPITNNGTITLSFVNQVAHKVFAAPSGSTGSPTFRTLVASDLPISNSSGITLLDSSGTLVIGTTGLAADSTTTKGDILARGSSTLGKLGVGPNGYVLTADSTQPKGMDWSATASTYTDPLTTKGDLVARSSSATTRLGVGSNGQVITADSAEATGFKWATPAVGFSSPLTTKGDILVFSTINDRLPIGSNGNLLVADSTTATGLKWAASSATLPNWLALDPDVPPASPNAMDDEFDSSATLPGGGSALWAWDNQGTATATVANSHLTLTALAATGDNDKSLIQTAPATPWEFTAKIWIPAHTGNYNTSGMVFIESVTGKRIVFCVNFNGDERLRVIYMTSSTIYLSTPYTGSLFLAKLVYLRVRDNGTNLIFSASLDGASWQQQTSISRTAHLVLGPNRVGLVAVSNDATYAIPLACDWFRRTL